jgi:hypothetical protein
MEVRLSVHAVVIQSGSQGGSDDGLTFTLVRSERLVLAWVVPTRKGKGLHR